MSLRAQLEAIIYAAETPISLDQISSLVKESLLAETPGLETLAVIAYKQPVTVPEISEIRGVDAGGVIATLLDRKLITTAGRKAVIGRPILYKTSKEFLLRFGLSDIHELPSMEEFEKLLAESFQSDLLPSEGTLVEASSSSPSASPSALEDDSSEAASAGEETETPASTKPE